LPATWFVWDVESTIKVLELVTPWEYSPIILLAEVDDPMYERAELVVP